MPLRLFAIDAAHSRDLDDAVRVDAVENGWRVTVAIANVADAVLMETELDRAAREIGFSRYSAACVRQPMLPRRLSEGDLTLARAAASGRAQLVARVDVHSDLSTTTPVVTKEPVGEIVRVPYEIAKAAVDDPDHELRDEFRPMWALASHLIEERRRRGALALYDVASGVVTDEEGAIVPLAHPDAHKGYIIVQELMILVNGALAEMCAAWDVPILYRNHRAKAVADRQVLMDDMELSARNRDYLTFAQGRAALMMERAYQAPTADGHFALNRPAYAWFTSPIRRYADLVNQRILMAQIDGIESPYGVDELKAIAAHINETVAASADAKAQFHKDAAAAKAKRQMTLENWALVSETDFARIVADIFKTHVIPDSVANEAVARIKADRLGEKELARLLFVASDGEPAAVVRQAVIDLLVSAPHKAAQITNYMAQAMDFQFETEAAPAGGVFTAVSKAMKEGSSTVSDVVYAATKKLSAQWSIINTLAKLAGVAPPASPEEPPAVDRGVPTAPSAPATGIDLDRAKGALQELCQKHKWPMPEYEVEASGPPHERVFVARCRLGVDGRPVQVVSAAAPSKKESEKKAAVAMLQQVAA